MCFICKKKKTMHTYKGRTHHTYFTIEVLSKQFLLFVNALLFAIPAFISCSKNGMAAEDRLEQNEITLRYALPSACGDSLDIYVYNQDQLRRLDAYCRMAAGADLPDNIKVCSRSGRKTIVALYGWPGAEEIGWASFSSYAALSKITVSLESENPSKPRLAGIVNLNAGVTAKPVITMSPVMARIRLNSIKCDFSGRPYEGAVLKNARVYLTNVCTRTSLNPQDSPGREYLNVGGWSQGDMSSFAAREFLEAALPPEISAKEVQPQICLYCYPVEGFYDNAAHPITKLVIEGELNNQKVYYPINIGDYTGGNIRADFTYSINLTISRMGSETPDVPLFPGTVDGSVQVLPWVENDVQKVYF